MFHEKSFVFFFFFLNFIYLFIFGCVGSSLLCEGSLQLRRAGATPHRGARASHRRGLSRCRAQAPRRAGSVGVAHGPSRSAACGILPDRGTNPCPPHWQADSPPLRHQGSPAFFLMHRFWKNIYRILIVTTFTSGEFDFISFFGGGGCALQLVES